MQEEDYFVLAVIRHRFGYMTAQVAQALLNNANQTVEQLIRSTTLQHESVAAALTAMLQHDIVCCQGPYEINRPPRVNANRGRTHSNNRNDSDIVESHHSYDVNTSLDHGSDITTRLYGNTAAGFVDHDVRPVNAVHQPIIPITKIEYDQPHIVSAAVTNYIYSINRGMARGLSRTPFYAGLVTEMLNQDAKFVIDEFIFRGKLTISKALEYVVERMVSEEDAIRRQEKRGHDGIDPNFTASDFNNMPRHELESLSIWAFNRARLIANRSTKELYGLDSSPDLSNQAVVGGIGANLLKIIDEIELSRYESMIPRAIAAFEKINSFFLLVESPGFLDPLMVNNASILFPTTLAPVSQPLNGITPSVALESSLKADLDALSKNSTGGDVSGLIAKKRKALDSALAQNDILASTTTTTATTTTTTTTTKPITASPYDDDDLFDAEPSGRQVKRLRANNTPLPHQHNHSTNSGSNDQSQPAFSAYQSPLSREQCLYILNHDRFTLLLRGEMFVDFVSTKIGLTAGLLIGALNFASLRFENPTYESAEFTVPMMKKAFQEYAKIKQKQFNPSLFTPAALEPMQQLINSQSNSPTTGAQRSSQQPHQPFPPTPNNVHGDYTSPLSAAQHLVLRPVTYKQLDVAVNRLTRSELPGSNNLELQFMVPVNPSSQTLSRTRTIINQERVSAQGGGPIDSFDEDWGKAYVINYQKIAQCLRREYLMTHLLTRWGSSGRRVIGTLLDHPRLEEKQVSDFSLVSKREVKEILHCCLREGIVDLLDVPTSSDRLNPSKVFYLWGMDYAHGGEKFLSIFYKSFANVLLRLDVQRDQSTQFIDKMLLQKHMEMSETEAYAGRDYKLLFARFMHVLQATMKVIIAFKDLCPS